MEEDADTTKVQDGFVSITPVQFDLTAYGALDQLREWKLEL